MRTLAAVCLAVSAAVAGGCDKASDRAEIPPATTTPGRAAPPAVGTAGPRAPKAPPVRRELPKLPPLTPESAAAVLHRQLDLVAADDESRRLLLDLADLGDPAGLAAAKERLLAQKDGKYESVSDAALGVEVLLAYGETGAGARAMAVAQQYQAEETEPDEWLAHMYVRVTGAERADAVARLVKIAGDDESEAQPAAIRGLATSAAREAADVFAKIAADKQLDGDRRGSAVAGLFKIGDARAKDLADKIVHQCTSEDDGPEPDEVIAGLGVEGATEASASIRRIIDALIASDDARVVFATQAAAPAIARIHAAGGGADLVPWLRGLHDKEEPNVEEETAVALWSLGDDAYAAEVAKGLEAALTNYAPSTDPQWIADILEIAARRGAAAKPPFRTAIDVAAQLPPLAETAKSGTDLGLVSVNTAAAHAFLKSSK